MSVTRKHTLYGVGAGSVLIGGITNCNLPNNLTVRGEPTSGSPYTSIQSVVAAAPAGSFTTLAIAKALGVTSLAGSDISLLAGGLVFYAQKFADGGTRAAGGAHRQYKAVKGLLTTQSISASHQGDATLSAAATIGYDGVNDPLVETDGVSLPAGLVDNERFTLGPVTIAGVLLSHLKSMGLSFGVQVESEGSDSDLHPTHITVSQIQPVLTLGGIDVEWLKSTVIPRLGRTAAHGDTKAYLRKRADGGTYVPDATAQHIKFTMAGYSFIDSIFAASGTSAAETSIVVPLKYDGNNDPLTINTASTIT